MNSGNLSGEERASIRGHRAGSRSGSAYGGSVRSHSGETGGDSSTEGEGTGASPAAARNGSQPRERVWCDGCGRGWMKGAREACECEDKSRWQVSVVPSSRTSTGGGSQYRGE